MTTIFIKDSSQNLIMPERTKERVLNEIQDNLKANNLHYKIIRRNNKDYGILFNDVGLEAHLRFADIHLYFSQQIELKKKNKYAQQNKIIKTLVETLHSSLIEDRNHPPLQEKINLNYPVSLLDLYRNEVNHKSNKLRIDYTFSLTK